METIVRKICNHDLYDIDDLVSIWESGWHELAKFCERVGFQRKYDSSDKAFSPDKCVWWCIEEIITEINYNENPTSLRLPFGVLQGLSAAPDNEYISTSFHKHSFQYILKGGDKRVRKSLKKITKAFATSSALGEILEKIATPSNLKRLFDTHGLKEFKSCGGYLKIKIRPQWQKIMQYLGNGLSSKKACEEAWWNCVWVILEPKIKDFRKIRRQIERDIPLQDYENNIINEHIKYGYPLCISLIHERGDQSRQITLKPGIHGQRNPLYIAAYTLLVEPAFVLAQEFQKRCSKPRFLVQCHAPSCDKYFYTYRKTQVVCGSPKKGKTSNCRKEWFRYMRRLKDLGKKPEKDWNNPQLIKHFLQQS